MVFGITPSLYVKAGSFVFGGYGLQMLFTPTAMQNDHFDAPATKYTDVGCRIASLLANSPYCLPRYLREARSP